MPTYQEEPPQFWVKEDHQAPLLIALIGPIEYWWNTPDDPNRFMSKAAVEYRHHRDLLSNMLTSAGYLVYRPHEAFKGGWDERAQVINDAAIQNADVVLDMTPRDIPTGKGTGHEIEVARDRGIPVCRFGPNDNQQGLFAYLEELATAKV